MPKFTCHFSSMSHHISANKPPLHLHQWATISPPKSHNISDHEPPQIREMCWLLGSTPVCWDLRAEKAGQNWSMTICTIGRLHFEKQFFRFAGCWTFNTSHTVQCFCLLLASTSFDLTTCSPSVADPVHFWPAQTFAKKLIRILIYIYRITQNIFVL